MIDESQSESGSQKSKFQKLLDELRNAARVLAGSPRVIRLVWDSSPYYVVLLAVISILQGLLPLANVFVSKLIVDLVSESVVKSLPLVSFEFSTIFSAAAVAKLLPLLGVMCALEVTSSLLQPSSRYLQDLLGDKLSNDINEKILRKANSLVDLSFFENSQFYDKLEKAEQESGYRPIHMLDGVLIILSSSVQFVAAITSFMFLQPVVCVVILAFALPSLSLQFKHNRERWAMHRWEFPEVRRMQYFRYVLTNKYHAAEVRMFSLGDFFLGKYLEKYGEFFETHKKIRRKQWGKSMLLGMLATISDVGAYAYLALKTITGSISIGSFYFFSNVLSQIQSQLHNLIWATASLYEDNLFMNNLFEFLELEPSMHPPDPAWALKAPKPIKQGIEFRNVCFHYPDAAKDVLNDLSFTLGPNQTVALVGENGAGKTTIVKLLGRLYDPTAGEILVDGINLKDIDLESWRQQMAVIFQDFAAYQLTAGENIGVGQVNFIEDEIRIKAAAERGGATAVIEKLPAKYDTLLGKWFGMKEEASDLSGGEWQKMALSRAFMRAPSSEINEHDAEISSHLKDGAAQLLILDEPTASLDVQSEHEVYLRFQELTRGKITVLISHRFSTVRMAKLILLLEDGKIAEQGSHEELMALSGKYAHLYKLQADKYT